MAVSIGIVHLFGEFIHKNLGSHKFLVKSFSAGLTVSYFFLVLLPETMNNNVGSINNLSVLAGFSLFYIIEELLYESEKNLGTIKKEFKEVHSVFISTYHIIIGLMLVFLLEESFNQLILFYIPVLIHTGVNSISMKEMHEQILEKRFYKILVSFSTLIGVSINLIVDITADILYPMLGFIGGAFVYLVIHDALEPRKERPIGFIIGVLTMLLISTLI